MTMRVLLIDDDAVDRQSIRRMLSKSALNIQLEEAGSAEDAWNTLRDNEYDCVLLDYHLPDMGCMDLFESLRLVEKGDFPPVVILTGAGNESVVVEVMKAGVQDYIPKANLSMETVENVMQHAIKVVERERRQEKAQSKLKQLAMFDELTKIGNRHFFTMRFNHALIRAGRQLDSVCLILLDLNGFKKINDTWGHLAGDEVLREISRRLAHTARNADTVARIGGDEFVVLMETGVSREGTALLTDRIREQLTLPIAIDDHEVQVGVSIGTATFPEQGDDSVSLMSTADREMYKAKLAASSARESASPAREGVSSR
jgi:diguanylate cyclase (GGDEF)-like protein